MPMPHDEGTSSETAVAHSFEQTPTTRMSGSFGELSVLSSAEQFWQVAIAISSCTSTLIVLLDYNGI